MIEYKIVSTPKPDRFEQTVTDMLNDGWTLEGSVFVSGTGAMTQGLTRTKKTTARQKKSEV